MLLVLRVRRGEVGALRLSFSVRGAVSPAEALLSGEPRCGAGNTPRGERQKREGASYTVLARFGADVGTGFACSAECFERL